MPNRNSGENNTDNSSRYGNNANNQENSANVESARRLANIKTALQGAFQTVGSDFTLCIAEVKRAYRKKTLNCHPDKGGDPENFKALGNAMEKIVITINNYLGHFPEADPDRATHSG